MSVPATAAVSTVGEVTSDTTVIPAQPSAASQDKVCFETQKAFAMNRVFVIFLLRLSPSPQVLSDQALLQKMQRPIKDLVWMQMSKSWYVGNIFCYGSFSCSRYDLQVHVHSDHIILMIILMWTLSCLKEATSENFVNGEGGRKRPASAANDIPQKKVKMDLNKVSFCHILIVNRNISS